MNDSQKKVKKSDFSITVLLIVGILAVLNFFSYQIFFRGDLTQNKIYSISQASKKTVANLDDIVNINAYFSDNLPSQVMLIKQEVQDILAEYEAFSNGKVKVNFIDPNDDEDLQKKLRNIGIPQLTFDVFERDKRQLVNGYMGIAINYGGKTETIPAIKSDTTDLEYQITTSIKKVTSESIATIGYLSSQGTADLNQKLTAVAKKLQDLYVLKEINLTEEDAKIDDDVDTLIIVGPQEDFNDSQLRAINSFLLRGGALLALVDGTVMGDGLVVSKNSVNFIDYLEKYGLQVHRNLVADVNSGVASFSQGFFSFSTNYPFWPKINNAGFAKDFSAVSSLESVVFPWVSSIDILPAAGQAETVKLAKTSDKSWQESENFNVNPQQNLSPKGEQKSFTVAVSLRGQVPNAFSTDDNKNDNINDARIIVVGDSDFAYDNFIGTSPENLTFFLNLVDTLTLDEDLISIRSKASPNRPIKENLSYGTITAIRYLNVFGITVLVLIYGLGRYFLRRKSRFVDNL